MHPSAIAVFVGPAILEVAGCRWIHTLTVSILWNLVLPDSTNAILNRDVAPVVISGAPVNTILAAAGRLGIAVGELSPTRKTSELLSNANKRDKKRNNRIHNPSPRATLYEDGENRNNDHDDHYHDSRIKKRDTPTVIGGVLIGARREDFQSPKAEEIMKRESAGHSRAENSSPSVTLDERDDPDASDSVLGLLGIVLGGITSAIGVQQAGSSSGWRNL
ncbi:hypothetical protein BPAE_0095g00060 [Botrytis paeoniae]|uniref:Uncharacterized protein n=1 Tax=Botrytis paeoniae TaxID=278948 RepID=A0A4Z1FMI0_9HELO|nr:hypothetical protein BPAE_0095g00060 [Botrytis paeoniae]